MQFAPENPVDCPSEAADNGDIDRLGSRRARENSQRTACLCNAVKSYLPAHGTFHEIARHVLYIFADAIRTERAEAKIVVEILDTILLRCNPHGTRRGKEGWLQG